MMARFGPAQLVWAAGATLFALPAAAQTSVAQLPTS